MSNKRDVLRLKRGQDRDEVDAAIDRTEAEYADKLEAYHCPETAQAWWDVLKDWWPEIVAIWRQFIPAMLDDATLLQMRKERKQELETFCHRAWANAPDNGVIHTLPGWGVLCDLCSEAGVLVDDKTFAIIPVPHEVDEPVASEYSCGAAFCDDPACVTHGAKDTDGNLKFNAKLVKGTRTVAGIEALKQEVERKL